MIPIATAVVVALVVVAKVLVWAATAIGAVIVVLEDLAMDLLAGVDVIIVCMIEIFLTFVSTVPSSVDVPSDVAVDLSMNAWPATTLGVLAGLSVKVLSGVSANAFGAAMIASEFFVPTILDAFSC